MIEPPIEEIVRRIVEAFRPRRIVLFGSRAAGADLAGLEADCRLLTPYAVLLRYPATSAEPTEEEGREAVAAAERVRREVMPTLPGGAITS